ncbi:MAG: DNA-3-methyladenine glycosylase [Myxococcales bacterium]|nr:DNA-3-methyladenine glycosylase [Myxococcales bacterium]
MCMRDTEMTQVQNTIPDGTPQYWQDAKNYLSEIDPIMAKIIARFAHKNEQILHSKGDLFYTLANAIVGQQISAAAASAIWGRVIEYCGGHITASLICKAPFQELKNLGLSQRKVEYLQGTAQAMPKLLEFPWGAMNDQEVRETLCTLRGIGPWTAEMLLIFTLLRPDILPLGDIGVIRAVENQYNASKRLSKDQVAEIAEKWSPYRTVAVWYLWRTIDAEPVAY